MRRCASQLCAHKGGAGGGFRGAAPEGVRPPHPPPTTMQQAKVGFGVSCVVFGVGLLYLSYEAAIVAEERRLERELDDRLAKKAAQNSPSS